MPSSEGSSSPSDPSSLTAGGDRDRVEASARAQSESASRVVAATGRGPRAPWNRWSRRIALVATVPLVLAFVPHFYNNLALLTTMAVYIVLAEGVNVIYGYTGYLPFGYVAFFGVGAYGAALSITYWHSPGFVALLVGGAAAGLIGLVLSPLLRLSGAYFALATLAASQVLYYIVVNEPWTLGVNGTSLPLVFSASQTYIVALIIVAIAIATVVFIRESHFGLSLRAIRSDSVSAAMAGVNVVRTRAFAWFISATLAGLAGAIWAIMTSAFYAAGPFDIQISVYAIIFALFGGVRTVLGPVLGAVALYSLYQYIGISNPQYFELAFGLLIVALVLFLPGGLSSLVGGSESRPAWLNRMVARVSRSSTPPVDVAQADAVGTRETGDDEAS